jgi:hypothetical protein
VDVCTALTQSSVEHLRLENIPPEDVGALLPTIAQCNHIERLEVVGMSVISSPAMRHDIDAPVGPFLCPALTHLGIYGSECGTELFSFIGAAATKLPKLQRFFIDILGDMSSQVFEHILSPFKGHSSLEILDVRPEHVRKQSHPCRSDLWVIPHMLLLEQSCPKLRVFHYMVFDGGNFQDYCGELSDVRVNSPLGVEEITSFARTCKLRVIDLRNVALSPAVITAFFKGLEENEFVEAIFLQNSLIPLNCLPVLMNCVTSNKNLAIFDLTSGDGKFSSYYVEDFEAYTGGFDRTPAQTSVHLVPKRSAAPLAGAESSDESEPSEEAEPSNESESSDEDPGERPERPRRPREPDWPGVFNNALKEIGERLDENSRRRARLELRPVVDHFLYKAMDASLATEVSDAVLAELDASGHLHTAVRLKEVANAHTTGEPSIALRTAVEGSHRRRKQLRDEATKMMSRAIKSGDTSLAQAAIDRGFPVNGKGHFASASNELLLDAVRSLNPAMVKLLVQNKAQDSNGKVRSLILETLHAISIVQGLESGDLVLSSKQIQERLSPAATGHVSISAGKVVSIDYELTSDTELLSMLLSALDAGSPATAATSAASSPALTTAATSTATTASTATASTSTATAAATDAATTGEASSASSNAAIGGILIGGETTTADLFKAIDDGDTQKLAEALKSPRRTFNLRATDDASGANLALMRALSNPRASVELFTLLMLAPEGAEDIGGHVEAAVWQMLQSGRHDFHALMPIYNLLTQVKRQALRQAT